MSKGSKYLLVSLPTSITPSRHADEALDAVRATVTQDVGATFPFAIPTFKMGTLDALVQQADDLAKLDAQCEGIVAKVGDALRNLLDGNEERIRQQKTINDKPVDQYLKTFQWNKVKYRADRPLADLIDALQKEAAGIDNDVKAKYNQYNASKTSLAASQRRQTGNLATKSLTAVVKPAELVQDSEYLDTHLIAVPNAAVKDFYRAYETLADMVVPRSANKIAADDEFTLFSVVVFKKHSPDFVHRVREKRWTPRDFKYKEGGQEAEAREVDKLDKDTSKLWGEALRLAHTGYSESAMIWIHVLALRVFVETVLRYGLPLDFVCGLVQTPNAKQAKSAKDKLDANYSYLAGNAFGRDSKGRIKKDDQSTQQEMQTAGHLGESEYSPYVYYEFEVA